MEGGYIIREERRLIIEKYGTINDQLDNDQQDSDQQPVVTSEPDGSAVKFANAVLMLITYAIAIGNIALGSIYINDCPAERMLPIGFIVFGGILAVSRILNCLHDYRNIFEDSEDTPSWLIMLNAIFILAALGMFIAICYWIITISPTTNPKDHGLKNYCDSTFLYVSTGECILYFICVCCGCGCCK